MKESHPISHSIAGGHSAARRRVGRCDFRTIAWVSPNQTIKIPAGFAFGPEADVQTSRTEAVFSTVRLLNGNVAARLQPIPGNLTGGELRTASPRP
jgi:hypothetical protein